jgi:hypothetical protein
MSENPEPLAAPLIAAARADVERLATTGRWTAADAAELDRAFERSATGALRALRLAERSLLLRRIARRFVPASARPYLRRMLAFAERPLRVVRAGTNR